MPDLATELSHLELADKHIAEARGRIAEAVSRAKEHPGADVPGAKDLLETMTGTLAAYEAHRILILETIADIREGKLRKG